jgi:hypothetical protein
MNIELLYFEGCPSWQDGLENLKASLKAENIPDEVHLLLVNDNESAEREKFLGSPSFRINGQDLWPEDRQDYYLGCRVYQTPVGLRGTPDADMLRAKIKEIMQRKP